VKKEDSLTISVATFLRMQYPDVLAFHIANERKTSPRHGAKLKRMGVLAGVSDFFIAEARRGFNGMFLELKIKPNKLTENQKTFIQKAQRKGYKAYVAYDIDEAIKVIEEYLK
jgi:hypothetical protein